MNIIRLFRRRPIYIGTVHTAAELVAALTAAAAVTRSKGGRQ